MKPNEKLAAILVWQDFKGTCFDMLVMMESVDLSRMKEIQESTHPDLSLTEYLVKFGFARYASSDEVEVFIDVEDPIKGNKK